MTVKTKDLISMNDLSKNEIEGLIDLAIRLKKGKVKKKPLKGKTLAMVFAKSSTRTRVSFEVGMYQLGGQPLFLSSRDLQIGRGEPIADTAKVLSRYVNGIMIRTYSHEDVITLAQEASVPVINGLTDDEHPCQILADFQTIYEHKNTFNVTVAYVGDGNNVVVSLAYACETLGVPLRVASPKGYEVPEGIRAKTPSVTYVNDPYEAVAGADVVYTDVWASMGQEGEQAKRVAAFKDYQVNSALVAGCKDDFIFLHCLPAHRGEEVTGNIIDGKHSVVFDEAENRLHAQKAVMVALLGK